MIKFGVIGYGYWGPNVVRNLDHTDGCKVIAICDKTPASRKRAQKAYPAIPVTSQAEELINSAEVDAIAVITPVWTHYELTKAALEQGKHVFVEKPFTSSVVQAEELINLAVKKNLKIMVDHTFLFTGAVKKIRQLLKEGSLEASTTMTQPGSISGFSNMTSMSFGTWRRTIFRSWIT